MRDRLEHAIFVAFSACLGILPRPLALRAGAAVGSVLFVVARPQRRIALRNLGIAFPAESEAARRAILHRACRNLGRVAAEFCHLGDLTPSTVGRYVEIDDPETWRRTMAERGGRSSATPGRGAVILTGHFGNWELLAYAQGLFGHPVTIIHRPMRNPWVEAAIVRVRGGAGTRSVRKKAAAREAIRALHRGELLVIPADQNQTRRYGVFATFFGLPASTTTGPARLAAITGAPIIPVFLVREGESERHRMIILPPIERAQSGNRAADVAATTQRCNDVIEHMLRRYPDHWIWFHKRWRTRPEGEPRVY